MTGGTEFPFRALQTTKQKLPGLERIAVQHKHQHNVDRIS